MYNDGTVMWIPQGIYKSSCSIDITHFPFDEQRCKMKFGSWTYDGAKLDVHFYDNGTGFDFGDYIESNEWDIKEFTAKKNIKKYNCCPEIYPDLTFSMVLKRKVAFYNYILILPCVLLSSLTLVLFWLPPESPAKMQLGNISNIYVAHCVTKGDSICQSGPVQPESILGRVSLKTVKEEVASFSLGFQHWEEAQRLVSSYQYNGSGRVHLTSLW